ncbi:LPS export ABC transporter permease LptF [bacterium]|nr:LPS export ABC transporter permease LptF [bacterium]
MFKRFDRYIFKEILPPFLLGLLVYTFVLLMNQMLQLSEIFITREIAFKDVVDFFIYLFPSILAFTVPMSVLVGVLAGLSRLSSDTEITAFKTLGVSYKRLLRPVLIFSVTGWLLTSFLTLYLAPHANYKWVQSLSRSVLGKIELNIDPHEFNESIPHTVLYIQEITPPGQWENIFVHFSHSPKEPKIISASRGKLNFYPQKKRATIELFDGVLHSFRLTHPEKYSLTSFEHLERELEVKNMYAAVSEKKRVREKDIGELFTDIKAIQGKLDENPSHREKEEMSQKERKKYNLHWVEVHKKFALPFACLIFALLALPLGAYTRKGGRSSGFTLSIGIILIYYILITAGEKLAMEGQVSPFLGIWTGNILFGFMAVFLFMQSLKEATPSWHIPAVFKKKKRESPSPGKRKSSFFTPRLSLRFPNILDRYILRKYLFIFSIIFVSLLSIFVIVTFFERIDSVYENNQPLSLFLDYIWYRFPEFIHFILPVSVLTATLLCLGFLTKNNEITAMKASGVSIYRIVLPIILIGGIVSFGSFYLQENVLPYSNKKVEETWNKINKIPPRSYSHLDRRWVMSKDKNTIYHYKYFDPIASVFSQLSLYKFSEDPWSLKKRVYAEKGYLKDGELTLRHCWSREFSENSPSNFTRKKKIKIAPVEKKDYFVKERKEPEQMNYGELKQYIRDLKEKGFETLRFKVDLNYKLSFPVVSLIMIFLGIPFAFSMGKRGTLVGIGVSMATAMLYWGTLGLFKSFGYVSYLSPFLAAWGPNLIFGSIGLYLLFTLRS